MRSGDALLDALIARSLDPAEFSHRDHVAAAFAALDRFEFFQAMLVYADGLRDLARRAGVPDKFNATVTAAFMSLIAEHKAEGFRDPDEMLRAHPQLLSHDLLGRWFSANRMTTDLARRIAVMPDQVVALQAQPEQG
ncbi:MAG: hypothetical protein AAGP08_02415 [Pseudomonadota bacterium]